MCTGARTSCSTFSRARWTCMLDTKFLGQVLESVCFYLGLGHTLSLSGLFSSALLPCSRPVDSRSSFARGVRVPRSSSCHLRLLPIQLPISNRQSGNLQSTG